MWQWHDLFAAFNPIQIFIASGRTAVHEEELEKVALNAAVRLRRDGVTLNFNLLTQNAIRSSVSQDAPVTKVWRKSVNRYWRYRGNIKLPRETRTDG